MSKRKTRPCAVCMKPLEPDRIEGFPETRLCLVHAKEIEAYGGEFIVTATRDRTSKAESIKKNFGGVTTKMRRNYVALERLINAYKDQQEQAGEQR